MFYLLFLLIIPVIIHLFNFRKYTKVLFTNVEFLKQIKTKNRKSSQIKKYLILISRLLAFVFLILAFSKPYTSGEITKYSDSLIIYLDNSISMSVEENGGDLFGVYRNKLKKTSEKYTKITFLTNNRTYPDLTYSNFIEVLKELKLSGASNDLTYISNKIKEIKGFHKIRTLIISDLQNVKELPNILNNKNVFIINKLNNDIDNILIKNIIEYTSPDQGLNLFVEIENKGSKKTNIPISLKNDEVLLAKQTFDIDSAEVKSINFKIKESHIKGIVNIDYRDTYIFDNTFVFNKSESKKQNIAVIGLKNYFFDKLYPINSFNLKYYEEDISTEKLNSLDLLIINELENYKEFFAEKIMKYISNKGVVVYIPSINSHSLSDYLGVNLDKGYIENIKITDINTKSELLKDVFSSEVDNIEYVKVNKSFKIISDNTQEILGFDNGYSFLSKMNNNNLYVFSASISSSNTDFYRNELIVPVFYNLANIKNEKPRLSYQIGDNYFIKIPKKDVKNNVLKIKYKNNIYTPKQSINDKFVNVKLDGFIDAQGFYSIVSELNTVKIFSCNYPYQESSIEFLDTDSIEIKSVLNPDLDYVLDSVNSKVKLISYWRLFLSLCVVSLLLEIFLIKYYKV